MKCRCQLFYVCSALLAIDGVRRRRGPPQVIGREFTGSGIRDQAVSNNKQGRLDIAGNMRPGNYSDQLLNNSAASSNGVIIATDNVLTFPCSPLGRFRLAKLSSHCPKPRPYRARIYRRKLIREAIR